MAREINKLYDILSRFLISLRFIPTAGRNLPQNGTTISCLFIMPKQLVNLDVFFVNEVK
jgi:hypothetical protein